MTAPSFRAVDQQTGIVVEGPEGLANFPALHVNAAEVQALREEITTLRSQLKDEQDGARVEIDNLTDLLKASGKHVSNLSTTLAAYQVERDEAVLDRDEYRDRFDLACEERDAALARVRELEDKIAELKRDVEWMSVR